jgi:hypothetical protein
MLFDLRTGRPMGLGSVAPLSNKDPAAEAARRYTSASGQAGVCPPASYYEYGGTPGCRPLAPGGHLPAGARVTPPARKAVVTTAAAEQKRVSDAAVAQAVAAAAYATDAAAKKIAGDALAAARAEAIRLDVERKKAAGAKAMTAVAAVPVAERQQGGWLVTAAETVNAPGWTPPAPAATAGSGTAQGQTGGGGGSWGAGGQPDAAIGGSVGGGGFLGLTTKQLAIGAAALVVVGFLMWRGGHGAAAAA